MTLALNSRVKESIKTALAMTIAIGIALAMDWDRPYWAGFAVAFISLSTVGQSLNKGVMRMLGTLLALVVSLLIIALFVQDRWWFMFALVGWIGFCTYRMTVSKRAYFWFLAGFASVVISFDGGTDPAHAFDTAILRAEETALGVLVYTLVSTLLWPSSSRPGFEAATRALSEVQHRLYSAYLQSSIADGPEADRPSRLSPNQDITAPALDPRAIASQHDQALTQFGSTLAASLADSYEVWELRSQWQRFQQQAVAVREALERWHQSSDEFDALDLDALLPGATATTTEIERRFVAIEGLLAGETTPHSPQTIDLSYDSTRVQALTHFQRAAFALARAGLRRLDHLTRDQLDTLLDIKGLGTPATAPNQTSPPTSPQATGQSASQPTPPPPPRPSPSSKPGSGLLPHPDGMIAAVRAMAGLWLAYLLWIYLRVPGGNGIISMAGPMGMMLATNPRLPPSFILKPVLAAIAVAGGLYVLVMPQLSSFVGLGTMIFVYVFIVAYLFSTPQQGILRSIALAIFLTVIGVSNQQSYSFLTVVDTVVMFLIVITIMVLVSRFPFTMQPDKAFLRLLRRFFRSNDYLMSSLRWDPASKPTRLDRWRRAFHTHEVETLPQQLGDWGKAVDTAVLPGTTAQQVQALSARLQALGYRMRELLDTRADPQAALLVRDLLADLRVWRLGVQEALRLLSTAPSGTADDRLRERLSAKLAQLEGRIEETLNKADEGEISDHDGENFYRLLGAYRGFSDALVEYAVVAREIDWEPWRESRF